MTSVPALALGICILIAGVLCVLAAMFAVVLGWAAAEADDAEARQIRREHARRVHRPDIHARREGAQLVSLDVRRRTKENVHVWDR
jgi:hypothetical protein